MTENERSKSIDILFDAAKISNKFGPLIIAECDKNAAVSTTAAAIMLSSFTSAMGMSMHDAVSLFMSVHKQTEAMVKERT